jgi:hypothetical protein
MSYTPLGYTPGSGANVATDTISGAAFQRVKLAYGDENSVTDASATNPMPMAAYGELIEAIEAMRMEMHSLVRTIGQATPDTAGRLRVLIDSISASLTLATITTVTTVSTVTTLTNQTQLGGNPAFEQIPALMRVAADSLRRNITVS